MEFACAGLDPYAPDVHLNISAECKQAIGVSCSASDGSESGLGSGDGSGSGLGSGDGATGTRRTFGPQAGKGILDHFLDEGSAGREAKATDPRAPTSRRLFSHDESSDLCNESYATRLDFASPPTEAAWSDPTITECPGGTDLMDPGACGCEYDTHGDVEWIDGAYKCFKCPFDGAYRICMSGQCRCYDRCVGGDSPHCHDGKCMCSQCSGSIAPNPGTPATGSSEVSDRTPAVARGGTVVEATFWRDMTISPCVDSAHDSTCECPYNAWKDCPDGICSCFHHCDSHEEARMSHVSHHEWQCVTRCSAYGDELMMTSAAPSPPTDYIHATATVAASQGVATSAGPTITECPTTPGTTDYGACGCTHGSPEWIGGAFKCVECPDGDYDWQDNTCYSCAAGQRVFQGKCYAPEVFTDWHTLECENGDPLVPEYGTYTSDGTITECPGTPGTTDYDACGCDDDTHGKAEWLDGAYKCVKCPDGSMQSSGRCYSCPDGLLGEFQNGKPTCYDIGLCPDGLTVMQHIAVDLACPLSGDNIISHHQSAMCYTCPAGMSHVQKGSSAFDAPAQCLAEPEWGCASCPQGKLLVCASEWASSCDCYDEGTVAWKVWKCDSGGGGVIESAIHDATVAQMTITECPQNPDDPVACGCDYETHGRPVWLDTTYKCAKCPDGFGMDIEGQCYSCPTGASLEATGAGMKCIDHCNGNEQRIETREPVTLSCSTADQILGSTMNTWQWQPFYQCFDCPAGSGRVAFNHYMQSHFCYPQEEVSKSQKTDYR